jgi:hypothetical protein
VPFKATVSHVNEQIIGLLVAGSIFTLCRTILIFFDEFILIENISKNMLVKK